MYPTEDYQVLSDENFKRVLHGNRSIPNPKGYKKGDIVKFYGGTYNSYFITAKVKSVYEKGGTMKTTKGEREFIWISIGEETQKWPN